MNVYNFKLSTVLILMILSFGALTSCIEDEEPTTVNITVNEGPQGDIGGDFTGNGGSGSRVINWRNNLPTADYNADITAPSPGIFQMIVADADGKVVLDRSIVGGSQSDSIDGVTAQGKPGNWTVTIKLTSFSGDGSYSLSAGD